MNGVTTNKISVYENSLLFLRDACRNQLSDRSPGEARTLEMTLDGCLLSMASDTVVGAIVGSAELKRSLLEIPSNLGLSANDPKLRTALRADEERIAALLVSIFSSKLDEQVVLRLKDDSAQHFLDTVQDTLDQGLFLAQEHIRLAHRMIRKLSEASERLPSSLFITGVNKQESDPSFGGGFGDVFRGSHNNKPIALKRMRYYLSIPDDELRRMHLKFCREVLVWKDMHHPHILPFLGVDQHSFPPALCIVSPWMEHGTVLNYVKVHGHANVNKLLHEIALGLHYLHSRNVVHGDLRGGNILIKEDHTACLADFGLSIFSDATSPMNPTCGGSAHWMAPELLYPERFGCLEFARTPASDVYAFGCVCFEIFTGQHPFSNLPGPAATMKVVDGERPERPSGLPAVSDALWRHMTAYWSQNPTARPLAELVVQDMASLPPQANKMFIYQTLLSFLKESCCVLPPDEALMGQKILDGYLVSMAYENVVSAIVGSLECRKILLQFSSILYLTNNPRLRTALRADEERIAALLVSIFNSKPDEQVVLSLKDDSAQHFLDVVQDTLEKGLLQAKEHSRMARRIIRKLSEACDRLPSSLFITGVSGRDEHPNFGGGFGDVYRASHENQPVALKRLRHFLQDSESRRIIRLKFCREALVWKELRHPHILPFLGIDRDSFPSALCMVSPWMEHGTVLNYLKNYGHANVDKLLYEIAQGLEYLHSRDIVHGGLQGVNVLINNDLNACLADFGLSVGADVTSMSTSNRAGSVRWMAPELIDPERFGLHFRRTQASDVYAFGCVCFELYTGGPPFPRLRDTGALMAVVEGKRPERPTGIPAVSDKLWQYITEFWAQNPTDRPTTDAVVQRMVWPPQLKTSRPLPPRPSPLSPVSPPVNYLYKAITSSPYDASDSDEISFITGEILEIIEDQENWWKARRSDGSIGLVPSNYLRIF
ncbi:Kinase-like protein [Mycena venus]|uniref:mitogen-activated protein kinase kinase kinase n=1 Tax=Mycena venus TaxID=2733690 RepID=A0A8H6U3G0_9AGAR|nr:Kinase-like protein [Mycena venus]